MPKATLHTYCQGYLGVLRFCLMVQEFKLTELSLDEAASQELLQTPGSVVPLA